MNNKFNIDSLVGLAGIAAGLIGVGYALGTRSKMARISEKLDRSIEELASDIPVDIPQDMVERAVEKSVAFEVKQCVSKGMDAVTSDIKRDIHKQVSDAVEKEYSNIKETVLDELVNEASKIDAKRVRHDIESAAKKIALEKFDDNLDDLLEKFNENLDNTSRIYKSIANTITKPNGQEMVFRLG